MPFDIYILSFKDILDILLVAFLLYKSYKLMKSSGSINIFIGILVFIIIWVIVSQVLQMRLLGSIFDKLVSVGVIALIVLFQDEIRHFLLSLGSRHRSNSLFRFLKGNKKTDTEKEDIMPIVMACLNMSKGKVGALIVIEKDFPLDDIVRTGDLIDANPQRIGTSPSRCLRCITRNRCHGHYCIRRNWRHFHCLPRTIPFEVNSRRTGTYADGRQPDVTSQSNIKFM